MIPWELEAEADRSRLVFEEEKKEEYSAPRCSGQAPTHRHIPGKNWPQRDRREVRGEANRASWRLTIKDYGSMFVTQLSSTYCISIRMNCGKLLEGGSILSRGAKDEHAKLDRW